MASGPRQWQEHGVRQISVETHRKESSPRKVVYCCCRAQSLLLTRTQTPWACEPPSRVTVTFPRVSRWDQAVWVLGAQGPGCPQGAGHPAP